MPIGCRARLPTALITFRPNRETYCMLPRPSPLVYEPWPTGRWTTATPSTEATVSWLGLVGGNPPQRDGIHALELLFPTTLRSRITAKVPLPCAAPQLVSPSTKDSMVRAVLVPLDISTSDDFEDRSTRAERRALAVQDAGLQQERSPAL